jgi:hypothetical protein
MDGDGRGEVLVVDSGAGTLNGRSPGTGQLVRYPFTASSGLGSPVRLGGGWSQLSIYAPGDWNGDKKADLMGRTSDGRLLLYPGTGTGAVRSGSEIGHGWSAYTIVPCGDLTSDGFGDLLAVHRANGNLYLYRGNGRGGFYSGNQQVGRGWTNFSLYAAGDLNGDARADILGVRSDGALFRYFGLGNGRFLSAVQAGRGWGPYWLAAGARLDSDRYADIIGLNRTTWDMYYYRGLGGGSFSAAKKIGSGF